MRSGLTPPLPLGHRAGRRRAIAGSRRMAAAAVAAASAANTGTFTAVRHNSSARSLPSNLYLCCVSSNISAHGPGPAAAARAAVGGGGRLSWALPAWRRGWAAFQATYGGALRRAGGGAYSGQMQAASFGKNDVILAIFWTA